MPLPRVDDDGQTVTLDLHGARVDEAVDLARRLVGEAARRGRGTVRLIHGSSTTRSGGQRRTVKAALHALLDAGTMGTAVTDVWRAEDYVVLSLPLTPDRDSRPIRLRDVMP